MDELAIIDRIFRPLAGEGAFGLRDDAALIAMPPGRELVVTTDMIAAGVHFLPGDPPETIARKALRVNLSDLAAKGAEPLGYTLAIGLPADTREDWLVAFAQALAEDQTRYAIALLGGDTIDVKGGAAISVTAFGTVAAGRMVRRGGGRPGDALYVSGTIGDAAAGWALRAGRPGAWDALDAAAKASLIARHLVPEPRVALAPALAAHAHAALDVSDGLVGDCDKLAAVSGCCARIDAGLVPIAAGFPRQPGLLAALLTGGEDFEVFAAIPPAAEADFTGAAARAGVPVTRIGALVEGSGATEVTLAGRPLPIGRRAYVHGIAPP